MQLGGKLLRAGTLFLFVYSLYRNQVPDMEGWHSACKACKATLHLQRRALITVGDFLWCPYGKYENITRPTFHSHPVYLPIKYLTFDDFLRIN